MEETFRMDDRRSFLKSISGAALGAPLLPGLASAQSPVQRADVAVALPSPDSPHYWDKVRDQFSLARDNVFFNNGTIGAMPKVVVDRIVDHLHEMAEGIAEWDYAGEDSNWISGYGPLPQIRGKAARFLNVDASEIGLTENVTSGASYVAAGLDLQPGAEIITTNQEHEGGRSCWLVSGKRRKTVLTEVKMPVKIENPEQVIDLFKAAMTPKTKVLAFSHVITGTGAIMPVKEICAEARSRGIFTVLDGAQAFGHIPVDLKDIGCDAYVGCFHKWMLAPAGTGFIYLKKGAEPEVWASVASGQWDNNEDNGYRFTQRGTGSLSNMLGLEAALDFHTAIGPERVTQRIKYLGDYLRDGLRQIPKVTIHSPEKPEMCAGITVYGIAGVTGKQIQEQMWVRDRLRPRASGNRGVRHCTHIYNSTAEIDRALKVVRALAQA
jgi:isopenicillin-N epimerase